MSEEDSPNKALAAAAAAAAEVRIKREPVDESDIKDYAETTMNELLGWYGYDKVDIRDTEGLNLHRFTTGSPPLEGTSDDGRPFRDTERKSTGSPPSNSSSASTPKSTETPNLPSGYIVCAWCQKVGMKLFTLKTATGQKAFCSELCFTQCRRASFKKNKVCDWCKHIRHTVNYVDFQDGEQQLQFCSDKCLNQYKMNIFCKETQAHLQMHPHLQDAAKLAAAGTSAVTLITPDLWLRDCHEGSVNGHDIKPESSSHVDPSAAPPPPPSAPSVSSKSDELPVLVNLTKSSSSRKEGFLRHSSRLKDRHRRHRFSAKASSSLTVAAAETECPTPSTRRSSSPKSGSVQSTSQHSPSRPVRVVSGSPNPISPHSGFPPQVLGNHPHPSPLLPPTTDLPRPPFAPPFMPPYPFLNPTSDFLRLPGAGVRSGQPPFMIPPNMSFPPPPPPSAPSQGSTPAPHLSPLLSSLLPPVAVLVPYPVVLPIPIPIPIPIPVPMTNDQKNKEGTDKQQHSEAKAHPSKQKLFNSERSSASKRVDSVITRLVGPKLGPSSATSPTHGSKLGSSSSLRPGCLSPGLLSARTSLSVMGCGQSSDLLPPGCSEDSRTSTIPRGMGSSSEQSNGLDDSTDMSDFPDSDIMDAESEDSRHSDNRSSKEAVDNFSERTTPSTPTPAFSLHRERREAMEGEGLSRDSLEGEPDMKRKCLRTRLTAK